jgi:molybdate transport system substrate-binding protein
MYRVIQRIPFALAACVLACISPANAQIIMAAAASGRFAAEEIAATFQRSAGVEVKAVYGASGKLSAQIRNGAPFDVFVSADLAYPDSLRAWGHASGKAETYAFGKLVLWSAKGPDPERGMAILTDAAVTRIAIADPKAAPYGREAVKAMQRAGVYDKVHGKLVYGESISQVGQYVMTGNAEVGLSALSVVLSESARGKGKWKAVDSALYDPIAQGAVVTRYGRDNHPAEAARFLDYLRSDSARAILAKYGYGLP